MEALVLAVAVLAAEAPKPEAPRADVSDVVPEDRLSVENTDL